MAKELRLAVIKCVATIILAIFTMYTEMEAPMTNVINPTTTVTTEVSDTAGHPSSQVDDFQFSATQGNIICS